MTRHRRRSWRPLATAAVAAAILTTSLYGVQATVAQGGVLDASVGAVGDAASGTLALALGDRGAGLAQPVAGLAPGDVVHRFVDLTGSGTLDAQDVRLQVSAGSSPLVPVLQAEVAACDVPWADGACRDPRPLLAATTLSRLDTPQPLDRVLAAGGVLHLRVSLRLPQEAGGATAGRSTALTWTFSGGQGG